MRFLFRTETVLSGLTALKSFQGTVQDLDHLVSLAGAATLALDLWPETSVFLRAVNLKLADPRKTLEILQKRSDDAARCFVEFFPPGGRYQISDLKRAYFDPKTRPSSFCDLASRVGDSSIPAQELPPIILGGLFVFLDGHWAEIEWDSRLMEAESLLPLRIPYLDPQPAIEARFSLMEAPGHWGEVLAYQAMLQGGVHLRNPINYGLETGASASILVDPQNRILQTEVKCPGQGRYTEIETRTAYLPQGARKQEGFQFQWSSLNGYVIDRWSVIESGGRENRLDPRVSQFFLLPGAVWEVKGHSHEIHELDPARKRIDTIAVTPENRDDIERYIRRKADEARRLNRVPT